MKNFFLICFFILIIMEVNAMFSGIIFWDISIKDFDVEKLDKNDIVMCLKEKINIIYTIEETKILSYFYDKHCMEVNCDVNLEDLKANMKGFNDLLFSFVVDDMIVFTGINRIGRPPLAAKNMYDDKFIKLFEVRYINKYYLVFSNIPYSVLYSIKSGVDSDDGKIKKEYTILHNFFIKRKKLRMYFSEN
ncbi:hypothetical protein [Treponema pedis]|uniref:Uncharacterized protein n=4 Tax=Treponema pedis TaxID=409322 RepID=S6A7S1_9SPIR|nr:hypothetical protein TPE_0076 [Treponema pedis str. T A4]